MRSIRRRKFDRATYLKSYESGNTRQKPEQASSRAFVDWLDHDRAGLANIVFPRAARVAESQLVGFVVIDENFFLWVPLQRSL